MLESEVILSPSGECRAMLLRRMSLKKSEDPDAFRWGGVLLDVACDYFLTRDWPRYSAVPLRDHVAARLADVQGYLRDRPTPLRPLVDRLLAEEWLLSYGSMDGLRLAFERLARRSPAAAALRGAEREIERRQPELQAAFDEFYPRIRARFGADQSFAAISP